jgi:hypothetical protein
MNFGRNSKHVFLCWGSFFELCCVGLVSCTLISKQSEEFFSEESRNMLVYVGALYLGLLCVVLVSCTLISKQSEEDISEDSRNMLVYVGVFWLDYLVLF